ncbi:MAG: DNA-3-methyladenine glycosylase [Chloroflexota bacterium]
MISSQTLCPRPPFEFWHALAFLKRFPPTLGERLVLDGAVLGAARVAGRTLGFSVRETDGGDAPSLRCSLQADGPLTPEQTVAALDRIGDWLGVQDDLTPLYRLAEADPPFLAVVQRLYGYHQVRFFTPFENACWAVLGQRTPLSAARAAKHRLMERFGGAATLEGHRLLAFPEPADLADAPVRELADMVASARKADRLLGIAQAFAVTAPASFQQMTTDDLRAWLLALPGIGPWSASFILIRGFGRPDAPLAVGAAQTFDRELLDAARAVYGANLTADGLRSLSERYAGWVGYWGHYLRVAA